MYFKKEVFLIVGLAKSGIACGKFLLSFGAKCYFYESNAIVKERNLDMVSSMGGIVIGDLELDSVLREITTLVLSPGVPIDNTIAKKAKSLGKRITGEMEIGADYIKSPIIAVTGTNGKTTSVCMLEHIINNSNIKAVAVGNIGIPLTSVAKEIENETLAITEVSSFQLETCNRILPHIAVILNITPDHLSRHYTMDNYVFLKSKLLRNMRESEYAVLNYDDNLVKVFSDKTRAKIIYFSIKEKVNGAYLDNGGLFFKEEKIINESELSIKGVHNVQNALACIAVCKTLGIDNELISQGLKTFKGAKHRIEFVKEYKGVEYYNDSKSTNPDATIKAIETMSKPINLLLGGKDKGLDYTEIMNSLKGKNISSICLYGETRYKMLESARQVGLEKISLTEDMVTATKLASLKAKQGSCVLLSPACSSFDEFSGYEERGEKFIETVNGLI